jgi:dynein heavy chain
MSPWHDDFKQGKLFLETNLFISHRLILEAVDIGELYKNFKLLDIGVIKSHKEAYRLSSFRSLILLQTEKCRTTLWNRLNIN